MNDPNDQALDKLASEEFWAGVREKARRLTQAEHTTSTQARAEAQRRYDELRLIAERIASTEEFWAGVREKMRRLTQAEHTTSTQPAVEHDTTTMAKTEVLAAYGTTRVLARTNVVTRTNVEGELPVLLRAAAQGDQEAWNQLIERFNGLLWAIVRAHRLEAADATDVVQATWLRLVENLDRITGPEYLGAWLAATARRECLRVLHDAGRAQPMEEPPELPASHGADSEPEIAAVQSERDALLQRAMRELSPHCQRLLNLLMAPEPLSYAEISTALDLSIGSIGPTRARCLDCLRRHAHRLGLADAAEESA